MPEIAGETMEFESCLKYLSEESLQAAQKI